MFNSRKSKRLQTADIVKFNISYLKTQIILNQLLLTRLKGPFAAWQRLILNIGIDVECR